MIPVAMRFSAGDTVGRYTILRRLGQGGMGTVYQARDPDGRLVALKVPFENLLDDPGTQMRYEREQEIARQLDHPGVQRLIETGHLESADPETGRRAPYTVLAWVDGGLLREHLYEGKPLQVEEAVRLAVQLCEALAYCHAKGIVHRDLKPDNVQVTRDGRAVLMDFGAALLEGARKITTASLSAALGTPDYMSPEQVQGQRGDARSDVYALGVMLYEMLAGQPPYRGDTALAVMAQHVQSRPAPLRTRNRQVPPALEAVVAKAMRRDPAKRYQTMEALAHDLMHLDQVDAARLDAEAPEDRATPARTGGLGGLRWGALAAALAGAVVLLGLGIALGTRLAG
jgi:eukaryotic-like serine/threonine-protein kinase